MLGDFNIYEYSTSTVVRTKVDAYLERIQDYLGTDAEAFRQAIRAKPSEVAVEVTPGYDIEHDYPRDIDRYLTAEPWEGMARLRRDIELLLRNIAEKYGVPIKRPPSAGALLQVLAQHEIIPPAVRDDLRYAVSIANRAIHGFDIESVDEIKEVIYLAGRSIRELYRILDQMEHPG